MTILEKIIAHKTKEIAEAESLVPLKALQGSVQYQAETLSLKEYLGRPDASGIIAEIKRKSPSKGNLRPELSVKELSIKYMQSGASALSILTDNEFFGGSYEDLKTARIHNLCPILCKDFMIKEYQIHRARSYGADVILLIAAALKPARISELANVAHSLNLEVLLEVHTKDEIESAPIDDVDHVGVNCRNLHDFSVGTERFYEMVKYLPKGKSLIAESGMKSGKELAKLKIAGFQGFLIGEHFMKSPDPGKALRLMINDARTS